MVRVTQVAFPNIVSEASKVHHGGIVPKEVPATIIALSLNVIHTSVALSPSFLPMRLTALLHLHRPPSKSFLKEKMVMFWYGKLLVETDKLGEEGAGLPAEGAAVAAVGSMGLAVASHFDSGSVEKCVGFLCGWFRCEGRG